MKTLVKILGIAAIVTIVGAMLVGAVAFAQGPEGTPFGQGPRMGQGMGFVDADGDGVCDNCGAGGPVGQGPNFVDEDGDGVCDYMGTRPNFVDEDGDGLCDNCGAGQRMGRGRGYSQ